MTYDDFLETNEEMTYRFKGVSMLPLLRQGRDLFTVRHKKPGERCRKYDVVLYHRGSDYVLHRIIKVLPEGHYVILGDNCVAREYDTTDDDIIGIMTGYYRDRKAHSVDELGYRIYSRVHVFLSPARIFIRRSIGYAKRIVKKIISFSFRKKP